MPSTNTLTGTVVKDGSTWPIAGALVRLQGVGNNWDAQCNWATTNGAGEFTLTNCQNLQDSTEFRLFISPPDTASGDDTADTLGAQFFPTMNLSGYTYAGLLASPDDTDLGNLGLNTANILGVVKKQADDSTVVGDDVNANVSILTSGGWMGDSNMPLTAYGDGTFRVRLLAAEAPYGVVVKAEPNRWNDNTTLDDTFAPTGLPLDVTSYATGTATPEVVLPAINFWGKLLTPGGAIQSDAYVGGYVGSNSLANTIWGTQADDSGIVRLYIDRTAAASSPVSFYMNFNDPIGQKQRSYTITSSDGASSASPMILQPLQDNIRIIVTAGGLPVSGAQVNVNEANYTSYIGWDQTDSSGEATFAKSNASEGQVIEVQVTPSAAALAAGFASFNGPKTLPAANGGIHTINVELQPANVRVLVRTEAGTPLSQANVWINPMGLNTGFSGQTDDSGYARIAIPAQYLDDVMFIGAMPPWEMRSEYADRNYQEVRLTEPAGDGQPYTFIAELREANAKFLVVKPQSGAPPMQWAQLEFREPGGYMSIAWGNSDDQGLAAASLPNGTTDLYVSASPSSQDDTIYGRTKYVITVANGTVTSVVDDDSNPVPTASGRWVVSPKPAMYRATVRKPDNSPVPNTWVEVMKEQEGWLQYVDGANSNYNGKFGLTLEDDTYVLRARAPWGSEGLAQSADCTLIIRSQSVANESTCGDDIMLREPNLELNVLDPGGEPLFNSWACAGRDNSFNWVCESSNTDGRIAMLIDDTTSDLMVEVNPPWSEEGLAMKRLTITDDSFAANPNVEDTVVLPAPNVQIQVSLSGNTQEARWSWVSIMKVTGDDWTWIAGSPANGDGIANFSLDDTSGSTFCVGVYPPWERRDQYGSKETCNVSLASGTYSVNLLEANVSTVVIDAEGRRNVFGWAEIKQGGVTVGGSGLDERGRFSAALDADTTYEITFYPGWGRVGSPKTITVVVDENGDSDIPFEVALGSGNVTGTVQTGGQAYEGVVIVATRGSDVVTAVSDSDGAFRMELDSGSWNITTIEPDVAVATVTFGSGVTYNSPTLVVP